MTTTAQQQVLTEEEVDCLRLLAEGRPPDNPEILDALRAKGMLEPVDGQPPRLTAAARHAVGPPQPGVAPGIDN
ncbi:MAG: hypothetical protein M3Q40_00165 [Pseudomonadota bacterium]|nr:hypothetical protein [Pseudomonadota bacterium]